MNVSLTHELEKFVQAKVASGLYQTASEVIREGLRLLIEQEKQQTKLHELRREVGVGLEQAERGEVVPFSASKVLANVRKSRRKGKEGKG